MTVAIDLGVTQTKIYTSGKCRKFDSLVVEPPLHQAPPSVGLSGIEIGYSARTFYVGEKAAFDGEAANYPVRPQALDFHDDVRWCAALAALEETGPFDIYSGLPVFEYSAYKNAFEKHMTRMWEFSFGGRDKKVEVASVVVIPQGAGAYYSAVLDPSGKVTNQTRVQGKVLTLDLGGRTLNGVTMQGGKFRANGSFTLFKGMVNVYNNLRKLLYLTYGTPLSVYEVGVALRAKLLMIGNTPMDLTNDIKRAAASVWQEIRDGLELELPNWRTYHEILLAGASGFFLEEFEEFFEGIPVTLLENAEYANVRGYGYYGELQRSRRGAVPSGK